MMVVNPDLRMQSLPAMHIIPRDIPAYTPEEREALKQQKNKGYAGLSRAVDIVPWREYSYRHDNWLTFESPIPKKRDWKIFPTYSIMDNESYEYGSRMDTPLVPPSFELL